MIRYSRSLPLPILIHRKQESPPQKVIKVDGGHERGFFRSIRMRPTIDKHFRCQILWLILCFWWVQPEVRRSFVATSNSGSGNNLSHFISKYLPGEMITLLSANPTQCPRFSLDCEGNLWSDSFSSTMYSLWSLIFTTLFLRPGVILV